MKRLLVVGLAVLFIAGCAGKTRVESDLAIEGDGLFQGVGQAPLPGAELLPVSTADNSAGTGVARVLSSIIDVEPLQGFAERSRQHPGLSGIYVLEKGEESLLARAWMADYAQQSIDVQYFIWSTDNIGILAAEALLRAADRGVRVRVLVDDLLLDAAAKSLVALAAHPGIEIRIYNPVHTVGVPRVRRLYNLLTDFRGANQRMHDKTMVVDETFAVTGGRNMAAEYFDFGQGYNFRDRDVLLLGPVCGEIGTNFQNFWESDLAQPVESLLTYRKNRLDAVEIGRIYDEMHRYAADPVNFTPEVRLALADLPKKFPALLESLVWVKAVFLHDQPGKNDGGFGLGGGGETTSRLAEVVASAQERVIIQSPYLILTEEARKLFADLVLRGVEVRISTNSLGSTDNLAAFSGYRKQRRELLKAGILISEFRPQPQIQQELLVRYPALAAQAPVFAIHAKTLVVDGHTVFIGTFNLDPRSAHLNTEVGVLFTHPALASRVEEAIIRDMAPGNSWEAGKDRPDRKASWNKQLRLKIWEIFPMDAIL
jgi:putative cardiolipin synthase